MNRERWLLIGAVVVFFALGLYYYLLWPGGTGLAGKQRTTGVALAPSAEPPAPPLPPQSSPEGEATQGAPDEKTPLGRNPFLTEEEAERGKKAGTELTVKTIIAGRPRSVATIDGRTVLVGEMVGEETVVEIRPDAVVLESEGRRRILRVREPSVSVEVRERQR